MTDPCPVCGKADGTCGDQPLAFPPIHAIGEKGSELMADADEEKVYLPLQRSRRGKAGYRGENIVVVDDKGREHPEAVKKPRKGA